MLYNDYYYKFTQQICYTIHVHVYSYVNQ